MDARSHPAVVAVVQARMGSTRLPGKVLADIAGRPMLRWVVTRLARATTIDEVVVATTTLDQDDVLERYARGLGVRVVRGDATDVLSRYVAAAHLTEADIIVRVTSDCPFIDPGLTTEVVRALVDSDPPVDYVSNALPPRTFPRGLDAEAITRHALMEADRLDRDPGTREHVTPFVVDSGRFRTAVVSNDDDLSAVRWTVDTEADLEVARRIADHFGGRDTMDWRELLRAWIAHPDWRSLNAHVVQKDVRRQR